MHTTRGINSTSRATAAAIALLCLGGFVSGCSAEESAASDSHEPITVEEMGEVNKLTLTEKAADRLGIETSEVREDIAGGAIVDYAALMYDASGQTWVYVNPEPLVFMREAVEVTRIDGDVVTLSEGPAAGTDVVVVGAAELFGAEFDTAH